MNKLTQKDRLLRHMRDYGTITRAEAFNDYGIANPTARIAELRKLGYFIVTHETRGRNRYGEFTKYATYTLEGEPNGN